MCHVPSLGTMSNKLCSCQNIVNVCVAVIGILVNLFLVLVMNMQHDSSSWKFSTSMLSANVG